MGKVWTEGDDCRRCDGRGDPDCYRCHGSGWVYTRVTECASCGFLTEAGLGTEAVLCEDCALAERVTAMAREEERLAARP